MSRPPQRLRRIFAIPAVLALVTLAALVAGLIGDPAGWPLVWAAVAAPLLVAIACLSRKAA